MSAWTDETAVSPAERVETTPETQAPQRKRRILVVDDEPHARRALVELLSDEGYEVSSAGDGFKALGILREWPCEVLLTDWRMPVMDGITLVKKAREEQPDLGCVVMTAFGSVESAVEAMKAGADDYLTKPLNFDAVSLVLSRAMERIEERRELTNLRARHAEQREQSRTKILGASPAVQSLIAMIDQVAGARATVMITGESGTGKELIARMLHEKSGRVDKPFVRLHCAALAESLLESELFGHEKGAFTGASARREGRFEEANGGTLFLDEIGEISPAIQVKLLRFLQQREFERVGGNKTISVDVRVVAATNRDLEAEVKAGRFREDLYFRLNVIHIEAPPLRARPGDVPLLARHFVAKYAQENGRSIEEVAPEVMSALERYEWPGNVRELENVIERAVVLTDGKRLELRHLPPELLRQSGAAPGEIGVQIPGSTLAEIERYALLRTYEATGGSSAETAEMLGISVRKVQYRLREYREAGVVIEG
ncbi:sigma-54-dependent Fis family transcriptional regulator [Lujinxingia vulgaris]|uniref:Sigma-54-dependent Fis family transcriptional regulator n=1 Tax=Lujinxingia vulgaris TaxID=2600176 RepID=A0A5C6X9Z0_9DELT|nr:sigma-54 dependent transcriptional regulator [Lujinxingia vulgaris]TXD38695.1 sigma-54-dependent Fis family transcriptional regulator [Lujinxingia vulgaris]